LSSGAPQTGPFYANRFSPKQSLTPQAQHLCSLNWGKLESSVQERHIPMSLLDGAYFHPLLKLQIFHAYGVFYWNDETYSTQP
jgi:hypothetical protein